MEDFISQIYEDAFIIEYFKDFLSLSNSGRLLAARNCYNKATQQLEQLLLRISVYDTKTASFIQNLALQAKDVFDDTCNVKGLIEKDLLPALYNHIKNYTGIDVNEDKYRFISSDTGFLTIYDNETKLYLHDIYDPMWEAHEIASSIYDYSVDTFLIFGCGLGYLAYQIFLSSCGSTYINVYEDDTAIIDYAYRYGALSLIPKDHINVICNKDIEQLASGFIRDLCELPSRQFYFSPWKRNKYKTSCNDEINRLLINQDFELEIRSQSILNFRMNKKAHFLSFDEIKENYDYNEWIIVSAGPSLDECIPFLRENKEKKGIICVNTVFKRLCKENILPDIMVAADQYDDMENHISGYDNMSDNTLLISDWLTNWKYIKIYKGPICFVRTNASAILTESFCSNEPVWNISGTVSCLGIEAAVRLNTRKIYLVGQDLAYPSGRSYATGVSHPDNKRNNSKTKTLSVDGSMVETCDAFIWFRKSIEFQIKEYSSVKFINMSKHGARINGAGGIDE